MLRTDVNWYNIADTCYIANAQFFLKSIFAHLINYSSDPVTGLSCPTYLVPVRNKGGRHYGVFTLVRETILCPLGKNIFGRGGQGLP